MVGTDDDLLDDDGSAEEEPGAAEQLSRAAEKTVAWCRSFVTEELGPTGLVDPNTAWKLIYRAVMWTHDAHADHGIEVIPHIIDKDRVLTSDKRPKIRKLKAGESDTAGGWYAKALAVGDQLSTSLGLSGRTDLKTTLARVHRGAKVDQNTTSAAFETILGELINRYLQQVSGIASNRYCGKPSWAHLREHLRGYRFVTSQKEAPKPDLVVPLDDPMAILSLKWSMRDDHISQMIGEAVKVHSVRPDIAIFAVTNEFDLRRLLSVAEDPQIQRVYHVNLALLNTAHRPPALRTDLIEARKDIDTVRYVLINHKLRDLSELFADMLMVLSPDQRDVWVKAQKAAQRSKARADRTAQIQQ